MQGHNRLQGEIRLADYAPCVFSLVGYVSYG